MACEGCKRPHSHFDFDSLDLAGSGLLAFQGPTAAVGAPGDAGDSREAMRSRTWHVGWPARLSQRWGMIRAVMAAGPPTVANLRRAGVISRLWVVRVIDADAKAVVAFAKLTTRSA